MWITLCYSVDASLTIFEADKHISASKKQDVLCRSLNGVGLTGALPNDLIKLTALQIL